MSQMKSEYRFGLGSVAAIAVVVMMVACPLIVAEDAFADASESKDISSNSFPESWTIDSDHLNHLL